MASLLYSLSLTHTTDMEITTQSHPLRTITLRYDRAKPAPAFETQALHYFLEIHDRTWDIKQRVNKARLEMTGFQIEIEELEALLADAKAKFDHLQRAYDTNPYKPTLRVQLTRMLAEIRIFMDRFVPKLLTQTHAYYEYDDYIYEQDKWMEDTAFPQFRTIFQNYHDCSVDIVFFDEDLDDFRGALGVVKKQQGKYYDEMEALIDSYTDLNEQVELFLEAIEAFDATLFFDAHAIKNE